MTLRPRPVLAVAVAAAVAAGCSSTGEPGHTAAVDVVTVDAGGVTQTVVPAGDRFDRVTVTTATFGDTDGVDGVLELTVSGPGGERTTAAAGSDLRDNAPVTLAFEPFDDAGGETYELTFSYAGSEPLALYRNPHDPYADGDLRAADGDLVFALGHADRVAGTLDALGRTARETGARATADPPFLVVWVVALAATATALVRLRGRSARPGRAAASR